VALSPAYRLRQRRDFDWVYQTGTRRRATHLHVIAVAADSESASRFGISISKKVSKLAVVRNRIKRQIKAALRSLLPQVKPGYAVVIVVRASILDGNPATNYWEILRELEQLLRKAEVLHGN
jgi:ribonuclease P protein component